ncbi:MAG: pyrroline-5-carboxylate reductase [Blautia sp.]|jgi:pyrroline-5-carboxylate reductase
MKFGFIGCGNMASAIIGGALEKNILAKEDILASVKSEASVKKVEDKLGIRCTRDNIQVAQEADYLFLAVKPQFCAQVAEEIKGIQKEGQVMVSILAGKNIAWLKEQFGETKKIIRTMPNTPALVGEGFTAVCPDSLVSQEELQLVMKLLCSFGKAQLVTEPILDIIGAVSGSSPAFVFMFIEALADGAVAEGMPRKQAYEAAAQAVLGSAKMVLETGLHPGALKDMVCSPAGTTIEGVNVLEKEGMRSAVMDAVRACISKTKKL